MDLAASVQRLLIRKAVPAPAGTGSPTAARSPGAAVGEEDLESWEKALRQRASTAAVALDELAGERAGLAQLVARLEQRNEQPSPEVQSTLGHPPPAGPSTELRQALEEARLARQEALEQRLRAAQLWEQELAREATLLEQLRERIAQGTAWAQEALNRPRPCPPPPIEPTHPLPAPPSPSLGGEVVDGAIGPAAPGARAKVAQTAEHRVHARVQIAVEVDFESDDNFYAGISSDISEGGLFVATQDIRPIGSSLDVSLMLPSEGRIQAQGRVRWIRESNPFVDRSAPSGMGIQFESLPPEASQAIRRFLGQRDPILYED